MGGERKDLHSPTPLLIFDCRPPPWYTDLFLSPLPLPLKSKHSLAKITSALQASLREASPNLQENYDIFQIDLWQKLHNVKRVLWNFLEPSHFSLREKFLKILLSSLNPSLKRSRANTAKSRRPQVSWGQQCSV